MKYFGYIPIKFMKKYIFYFFQIGKGFDNWPVHLTDRYIDPNKIGSHNQKNKNENEIKIFYPQTRNKSFYTTSTMQRKLKSAINNLNWQTFKPIHISENI